MNDKDTREFASPEIDDDDAYDFLAGESEIDSLLDNLSLTLLSE